MFEDIEYEFKIRLMDLKSELKTKLGIKTDNKSDNKLELEPGMMLEDEIVIEI